MLALALGPAWCTGCGSAPAVAAAPAPFTIVVLPDTQYYAAKYPQVLEAQTRWIAREQQDAPISLVVHVGDIVDDDEPAQWERAAASLHQLDGVVPYVLTAGNHDYRRVGNRIARSSLLSAYFSLASSEGGATAAGTFEPSRLENSFAVVVMDGRPWLVLALEFGPRDAVLAWADRIAKHYASLPALLVTHAYLYSDSSRYDRASRPDQQWNPHLYVADDEPGAANDGEEIWRKLVSRNDNIRFVVCGHALENGVGRLTSRRADGSLVHQLLANFQTGPLGGAGYLRLMRFVPADRRVEVRTYSPYLDRFKTGPENQFDLAY